MQEVANIQFSKRELYPLLLLKTLGFVEGTTRFHKLMFILKNEFNIAINQKFIKYHYGPFSSELREDINYFLKKGLISEHTEYLGEGVNGFPVIKRKYTLSKAGEIVLGEIEFSKEELDAFQKVAKDWASAPLQDVIKHAKSLLSQ